MSIFYVLLTLLIPLVILANPLHSSSAIDRGTPTRPCPPTTNATNILRSEPAVPSPLDPLSRDNFGGLTPTTANGDVLNTTRCYCVSPHWKTDHTYGHYHLISYYNFHLQKVYSFADSCSSALLTPVTVGKNDHRRQPECLRTRSHDKVCDGEVKEEKFCYEFDGGVERDFYYFNKQKRGIPPVRGAWQESKERALEICEDVCMSRVGGLHVLDGEAFEKVVDDKVGLVTSEWSGIASYGNTDDMCEGCR